MAEYTKIAFKNVKLLKDEVLGIGSYGKVCRAECDELLCAAKIIHETLVDPTAEEQISSKGEHRLPMRRFQQECEFLSTIRHPNIVQYLGLWRDPQNGLPVLLMELLDGSLTNFLEKSSTPIPYSIQVNICHDIALALAFLHSNRIVHRDLSGNNVLMIGNLRAKVTDFGMASLASLSPGVTQRTFTMCPGTEVYMPPEAVDDHPVYGEKMDCFSFGVLTLQVLTRQFPKPGDRYKLTEVRRFLIITETVKKNVPEVERRQNSLALVDSQHPLRPIILECLKDKDVERPSAQQLCARLAGLKRSTQYRESVKSLTESSPSLTPEERVIKDLQQSAMEDRLEEKDIALAAELVENQKLKQQIAESNQLLREKDAELEKLSKQLKSSEELLALYEKQVAELKHMKGLDDRRGRQGISVPYELEIYEHKEEEKLDDLEACLKEVKRIGMSLSTFTTGDVHGSLPKLIHRKDSEVAICGNAVYIATSMATNLYTYNLAKANSDTLNCPQGNCSLAAVAGLLTTVGGGSCYSNKLFSLEKKKTNDEGQWIEEFPPMPTERWWATSLTTDEYLIVIGGWKEGKALKTVEVMDIKTREWSTAADLPEPLYRVSATIHEGVVYVAAGKDTFGMVTKSVYWCSLSILLKSTILEEESTHSRLDLWAKFADLPAFWSTCISVGDRLLSFGGTTSSGSATSAVYEYRQVTKNWEVTGHMTSTRSGCFVVKTNGSEVLILGGGKKEVDTADCDKLQSLAISNSSHR